MTTTDFILGPGHSHEHDAQIKKLCTYGALGSVIVGSLMYQPVREFTAAVVRILWLMCVWSTRG